MSDWHPIMWKRRYQRGITARIERAHRRGRYWWKITWSPDTVLFEAKLSCGYVESLDEAQQAADQCVKQRLERAATEESYGR